MKWLALALNLITGSQVKEYYCVIERLIYEQTNKPIDKSGR